MTLQLAEAHLLQSAVSVQPDKGAQGLPGAKELEEEPEQCKAPDELKSPMGEASNDLS